MLDDFGLLGEGPLPSDVHVPGRIETVGDKLVWSWLYPETADPYQGVTDFRKLLAIISAVPVGADCADWPLEFLQSARPHYTDPRGMLNAFTRINKTQDVERFARRYGVLGICRHGLPDSHDLKCRSQQDDLTRWNPSYSEPLDRWFFYVDLARSILSAAAALHQGRNASQRDWASIYLAQGGVGPIDELVEVFNQGPGLARNFIASAVTHWLGIGGVLPQLQWGNESDSNPSFSLTAKTFGLLGVQLMVGVAKGHSTYFCDGCGNPYLREGRKPQTGRRNFCRECGEKVSNRQRQKKHWNKLKAQANRG